MYVMAVSKVSASDAFWDALKGAYGQLPEGAHWTLAVASTDGTRAVNVMTADSVDSVRQFFERHAGGLGTTECFEVDAANAVGLGTEAAPGPGPEEQPPRLAGLAGDPGSPEESRAGPPERGPSRTPAPALAPSRAEAPARAPSRIPMPVARHRVAGPSAEGTIEARIAELLADYRIPSAQIGVLRDGQIADVAIGVTSVITGEPATTDTIYQLGSMSKTWTALAFMQLVDEGRVALDEPVRTWLPDFRVADPHVGAAVTPRHLLHHTNGIEELYGNPGEDDDVYERMVAAVADAPQVFPLGETHGYSAALGYAILARIMEVVDGERWDAIMRRRLFDPLGLSSTSGRRADVDRSRAATGHVLRSLHEGPVVAPVQYLPRAFGPAGNVSSTARDVLTMASVFLHGGRATDGTSILSPASIREMSESRVPIPDPFMFGPWWGLGLIVADWHGETVLAHDGSTIGQNARLRILPERNLAVTMLTNGGPRDGFYREAFNAILTDLCAVTVPDLPKPDPDLRLDVDRYTGAYERPAVRYEVAAVGGRLQLTLVRDPWQARAGGHPGRTIYGLLPIDETHFLMTSDDPLDDPQTCAIYGRGDGRALYLHTNSRVHPRA